MEKINVSSEDLAGTQQQDIHLERDILSPTRAAVVMSSCVFFSCMNSIMFFILRTEHTFRESPRYILFSNILISDSVHFLGSALLYSLATGRVHLLSALCGLLVMMPTVTFSISPLNLAVMSMERYVAICFPLRHTVFVTKNRTYISIAALWLLSSLNFTIDVSYKIVMDSHSLTTHNICSRRMLYIDTWQVEMSKIFNGFYFATVALILVYTYINIVAAARSASTDKESVSKAQRTVLLHLIQLGLCLSTFLYSSIYRAIDMFAAGTPLYLHLLFLNYFFIIILPRCLSPLIYGLRDNALRPLFLNYFRYKSSTVKPVLMTHMQ